MSNLPRWTDDFTTDATSDPGYEFSDLGIVYNAVDDRIEISSLSNERRFLRKTESTNDSGEITIDLEAFVGGTVSQDHYLSIRAFGYWFVSNRTLSGWIFNEEEENWRGINTPSNITLLNVHLQLFSTPYFSGISEVKFIKSPTDVQLLLDGSLFAVLPSRVVRGDLEIGNKDGAGSTFTTRINNLSIKADASLPKQPIITEPSTAGSISAAQEIIATVPASRLFLDLGAHAPGITGLANVVYDPGGSATAMTEDTGIPDGSGGTTGDFFLEIPANGVASDNRLVIKDEFVAANSVVITDDIDYDVLPSPSTQNDLIVEEDDLQCFFALSDSFAINQSNISLTQDLRKVPTIQNFDADGNNSSISFGTLDDLFNSIVFNSNGLSYSVSTVSFPIILDYDLGQEYSITAFRMGVFDQSGPELASIDIYSNTVAFSGAGIQGTLEETAYPVSQTPFNNWSTIEEIPIGPSVTIKTRFLRFYVPSSAYFTPAFTGTTAHFLLEVDILIETETLDSLNDNAQFEHRPSAGGAFVAFPGPGVTQGDGQVKIILPAGIQLTSGERKFISVKYKADLSD